MPRWGAALPGDSSRCSTPHEEGLKECRIRWSTPGRCTPSSILLILSKKTSPEFICSSGSARSKRRSIFECWCSFPAPRPRVEGSSPGLPRSIDPPTPGELQCCRYRDPPLRHRQGTILPEDTGVCRRPRKEKPLRTRLPGKAESRPT